MQIQIIDHEIATTSGNFRPTDHHDVFIDAKAGQVAIIQPDDKALLLNIE